ncbi:unnamed protein product [Allacma fusca]|uniref:Uncharacterized protein n=1 Tax=Allacma fusca TaxID=39272 RepID=A0A8J2KFZ6_9HEXA|nr:unnamed protein product [Allacma fusca]
MNPLYIPAWILSFLSPLAVSLSTRSLISNLDFNTQPYGYDPNDMNYFPLPENIIPANYNPLETPSNAEGLPLKVDFSIVLINVRDIEEMKQLVTLEMNLRVYWTDARLKNLTGGQKYVVIHPESFEKRLWQPDMFIDHAIDVKQPMLLTKPLSLRLFMDGAIRYSMRISVTLACQMNFKYYPGDTQHCNVDLKSYAYPNKILTLNWRNGTSSVKLDPALRLSNYELQVNNSKDFLAKSSSGTYSGIRFTVKMRRDMSYHLLQTYLPSSMFILVTFMSFIMPQDNGGVTITMTALLTMTAMFAAVRQNTPVVCYAKAIDIWMVVCMFFAFLVLVIQTTTMRLRHMKIEPELDETREDAKLIKNKPTIKTIFDKDPHDLETANRGISSQESFPMIAITNSSNEGDQRNDDITRRYSKETMPPVPTEDLNSAKIKEYKALGNKIRRISSILAPIAFLIFNSIYWTWLLGSREY